MANALHRAAVIRRYETVSYHGIRRWEVQTGKRWMSKLANMLLIPCKLLGDEVRLKHASLSRKGKGRCLDRNAVAESAPMSGQQFSNGCCGDAAGVI